MVTDNMRMVAGAVLAMIESGEVDFDMAVPIWPNRTKEDREMFTPERGYPRLTARDIAALAKFYEGD